MQVMSQVDTQHGDMIHDAQLDYYGKRLATCSSDKLIKIFNIDSKQNLIHIQDISAHEGPVWQICWAHPRFGSLLASCGYDRRVAIHEDATQQGTYSTIFQFQEALSSVNSISWAPQEYGAHIACASSDGHVYILSQTTDQYGSPIWTSIKTPNNNNSSTNPLGLNSVSWAPYGALGSVEQIDQNYGFNDQQDEQQQQQQQQLVPSPVRRFVTGGCDNIVRIWAIHDGTGLDPTPVLEQELKMHEGWVRDVAWAPSLGLPVNVVASCGEDGLVVIWMQESEGGEWKGEKLHKFDKPVWRLSWSITGNILAVSSGESDITLWKEAPNKKWVQVSNVSEKLATVQQQQQQLITTDQSPVDMIPVAEYSAENISSGNEITLDQQLQHDNNQEQYGQDYQNGEFEEQQIDDYNNNQDQYFDYSNNAQQFGEGQMQQDFSHENNMNNDFGGNNMFDTSSSNESQNQQTSQMLPPQQYQPNTNI